MPSDAVKARRRRILISVISAAATVISLVLAFIAIVPILTQNSSGVSKLDVDVEPYRPDALLVYRVPADTPVSGFPTVALDAPCSPDQQAWLDANGDLTSPYYFVTITNRATSGNVIVFSNLVGRGQQSAPASGSILVECDTAGSTTRIAPVRLDLASGTAAYYDRSRMEDAGESPDTPLIYNLQPGESGQFVLLIVSAQAFDGDVSYTVTSGADTAVKTMEFAAPIDTGGTAPGPTRVTLASDPIWAGCAPDSRVADCVAAG